MAGWRRSEQGLLASRGGRRFNKNKKYKTLLKGMAYVNE
jgi:hypothetical protein